MNKRLLNIFGVLVIVAMLFAVPTPAHAMDTCASHTLSFTPTTINHAYYMGSPWGDFYMNKYQYQVTFSNQSGHTCHLVIQSDFTTNNGWYFPDYYLFSTSKGHQPYTNTSFANRVCVWNDGAHRSATCTVDAPSGGQGSLLFYWAHPNPLTNHDTNVISVWTHDNADGTDYFQGSASFDVY